MERCSPDLTETGLKRPGDVTLRGVLNISRQPVLFSGVSSPTLI
jgi:hypothetical protein